MAHISRIGGTWYHDACAPLHRMHRDTESLPRLTERPSVPLLATGVQRAVEHATLALLALGIDSEPGADHGTAGELAGFRLAAGDELGRLSPRRARMPPRRARLRGVARRPI